MIALRRMFFTFLVLIVALGFTPLAAQPAQASGLTVSINNKSVYEGDSGSKQVWFLVSLSAPVPSGSPTVIVHYKTQNGTATVADNDYKPSPDLYDHVYFEDGEQAKAFPVTVYGDLKIEPDEYFYINLYNPSGCTIADGQGVCQIRNDDEPPYFNVWNLTAAEGNSGTKDVNVKVTLSWQCAQTVTVDFSTEYLGGGAEAGTDYHATNGTLTFNPGETSKTVTVSLIGDTMYEETEALLVVLSNPTNAWIRGGPGYLYIKNDDTKPSVSINDVTVDEGDYCKFSISLSAPSGVDSLMYCKTKDGTATAGLDYYEFSDRLNVILAGNVTAERWVLVKGDWLDEDNETFFVELYTPYNCTIADGQGMCTILDDDPTPELSISDVTVDPEGDSGTKDAEFAVSLSAPSGRTVTVDYGAVDGTATAGADYQATSGKLTFAPGETAKTISVPVIGEMLDEDDETFSMNLSNPTNATIKDGEGVATIVDDDPKPPVMSNIPDQSILEGESFNTIVLDDFVQDANNTDDEISWSCSGNNDLTVSIDANRIATIGIPYSGWNGSETITFTATDPDLFSDSDEANFTVINVAPTVYGGPDWEVYSGDTVSVNATFTDPGLSDTHTAAIDWGDGTTEPGAVNEGGGSGNVTGSHRYFVPGTYTVTITVTDNDGGVDHDSFAVEVHAVPVLIDIKPGSDQNSINLKSKGVIPVAILSTGDFDATTMDGETVRFGPGEVTPAHYAIEDVDDDGAPDMILHFKTQETGLGAEDIEAILTGQTQDGVHVIGVDVVRIVPPENKNKDNKK